jgi:hypothetical protein
VATPLNNYVRYPIRSNLQGLVDALHEPERVYRRRVNRLSPCRLLDSLGEEAIFDIHHLFLDNNPTIVNTTTTNPNLIMSNLLRPLNFETIQGAPHAILDKIVDRLPSF